jgi:hypothetical protein
MKPASYVKLEIARESTRKPNEKISPTSIVNETSDLLNDVSVIYFIILYWVALQESEKSIQNLDCVRIFTLASCTEYYDLSIHIILRYIYFIFKRNIFLKIMFMVTKQYLKIYGTILTIYEGFIMYLINKNYIII